MCPDPARAHVRNLLRAPTARSKHHVGRVRVTQAAWRPAQEDRWRFTEEEIAALEAETEDDETNRFDPWDLGSSFNMEPGLPRGYMVNDDSEIPWLPGIRKLTGRGKWWDPFVVE
jgi:hypothetical protein